MNNLRVPIVILVLILVALGAWYALAHQNPAATPPQTQTASTTISNSTPAQPEPASALDEATVAQQIVGAWQSTDDPNYSVTITSGGKWTDVYGGNASSSASQTGTYELFTSQNPDPDFTGVLESGVVYVKVSEGSSVLYFSVLQASDDELQLSYLDRGTTLSFSKVQ